MGLFRPALRLFASAGKPDGAGERPTPEGGPVEEIFGGICVKRKFLSGLLALCMVLSLLPVTVRAADYSGNWSGLTWELDGKKLTFSGIGAMSDTGKGGGPWGTSMPLNQIEEIVINEGISSIGGYLCYQCTGLTSVTIPGSVSSIEDGTFSNCPNLANIVILEGVTTIGKYAFYGNYDLISVVIPGSVTSIIL